MKRKLLNNLTKLAVIALAFTAGVHTANSQTNVTVSTTANWIGYMNVFDNNEAQTFQWGSAWAVADIKTVIDTEVNTITLYPNYNVYGTGDDPAYWTNGEYGNKIMEGNTYVEDNTLLGQTVNFSGAVSSNTLIEDYTAVAFIKVMDAGYTTLQLLTAPLIEGETFSITSNTADFPTAAFVQYGFSVTGLNGNPAHEEANGNIVVTAAEPGSTETEITANAADNWIGYMNVFDTDEAQTFQWGSAWALADIKTVLDTDNNNIILYPNYNVYGTGDDPSYWTNGEYGNKIMEGNTYVEDNSLLGQTVTFNGATVSNTLTEGYEAIAFIKVMDTGYATLSLVSAPLVTGENFSLVSSTGDFPTAAFVQYGFSVTGLNGNPAHEATNGNVVIGDEITAGVTDINKNKVVLYPNPAVNTLTITTTEAIGQISVYNIMGQKVMEASPGQESATLDVSSLPGGIYVINTTVNGKAFSGRFIKQ